MYRTGLLPYTAIFGGAFAFRHPPVVRAHHPKPPCHAVSCHAISIRDGKRKSRSRNSPHTRGMDETPIQKSGIWVAKSNLNACPGRKLTLSQADMTVAFTVHLRPRHAAISTKTTPNDTAAKALPSPTPQLESTPPSIP